MRVVEYISDKYPGKIFSREYCMGDLTKGIKNLNKGAVEKVCTEFLELMTKDMIDNNDHFLFPVHNFAYMNIIDACKNSHPDYRYDVVNDTDSFFQPVILGNGIRNIRSKTKRIYRARFIGKTKKYFESIIAQGHHY